MQERSSARTTCPVVVVYKNYAGGVAEDADVGIQPITRADFVPAKLFRSRSMNTPPAINMGRPFWSMACHRHVKYW